MSKTERIPEDDRPAPELAAMIDTVRKEEPVVDWSRVEAKLFAELDHARDVPRAIQSPPQQPSRRGVAYAVGALAIAAGALFAVTRRPELAPAVAPTIAITATTTAPAFVPMMGDDGHTFAKGAHLEGGATGLWLRAKGRIAIRMEPGAMATLLDDGMRIRLSLERGAVAADVVPVPGGEPFAVDVGPGKRVAVHGTKLRVALVADAVEVAVAEGVAVVGTPRGDERTTGTEIPAGSFGRFVSGGAGGERVTQLPQAVEKTVLSALLLALADGGGALGEEGAPSIVSASPSSSHGKAPLGKDSAAKPSTSLDPQPTPAPPVPPPNGLSEAQLAPALAKLDQELGVCAPSAASAAVTFAATLVIHVGTDGKAQLEGAEPGLDVKVRECVRSALARVTFPTADAPTVTRKPMVLTAK